MIRVKAEVLGDVTVLRVSGKITIHKGDEVLRAAVDTALKAGATKLLLDLTDVSYIDSAGMGELIFAYKRVFVDRKIPYKLLTCTTGRATDLLKLTRAGDSFPIYTDESTAIASFK